MRIQITYTVDLGDEADAEAVVKAGRDGINEQAAMVLSSARQDLEREFHLVGVVKGKPSERWADSIKAADADDAERKIVEADPKRVVAAVSSFPISQLQADALTEASD